MSRPIIVGETLWLRARGWKGEVRFIIDPSRHLALSEEDGPLLDATGLYDPEFRESPEDFESPDERPRLWPGHPYWWSQSAIRPGLKKIERTVPFWPSSEKSSWPPEASPNPGFTGTTCHNKRAIRAKSEDTDPPFMALQRRQECPR